MPLLIVSFMLTGYVAGWLSAKLTRAPPRALPITTTVCTFSNVLGLPLPLVSSLVSGLEAYRYDDEAQSRCVSYLFFANIAASVSMWTCEFDDISQLNHARFLSSLLRTLSAPSLTPLSVRLHSLVSTHYSLLSSGPRSSPSLPDLITPA